MSNALFLGIWEAADGEEFVLGANSFGLWEGVIRTCPGLQTLCSQPQGRARIATEQNGAGIRP